MLSISVYLRKIRTKAKKNKNVKTKGRKPSIKFFKNKNQKNSPGKLHFRELNARPKLIHNLRKPFFNSDIDIMIFCLLPKPQKRKFDKN